MMPKAQGGFIHNVLTQQTLTDHLNIGGAKDIVGLLVSNPTIGREPWKLANTVDGAIIQFSLGPESTSPSAMFVLYTVSWYHGEEQNNALEEPASVTVSSAM